MLKPETVEKLTKNVGEVYLKRELSGCKILKSDLKKTPEDSVKDGEGKMFENFVLECKDSEEKVILAEVDRGTIGGKPFFEVSFEKNKKDTIKIVGV